MNKKKTVRKLAIFLATLIFCESVMANTEISKFELISENIYEAVDSERTEEAIETTTDYISGDIVVTPAAVEEEEPLPGITDEVLSDSALDFVLDTEGIPDYAAATAMSNGRYSDLEESSKFYLNRYIGVREDTMTECENNGLGISEAIPMALLMQRLNIDYSKAVDMVINYKSQTAALESSMEYREKEYELGFLGQEEFKPELIDLLIEKYNIEEIISGFAVAQCIGADIREILTQDRSVIESNTEVFESAIEKSTSNVNPISVNIFKPVINNAEEQVTDESTLSLANKYSIKAECLSNYMVENDLTADEMEIEILAMRVELGIDDESFITDKLGSSIQTYSESGDATESNLSNDSAYKEGPFNYKTSVTDNVDVGTGLLTYTDNVLNIPGKNGLDLDINLMYFSKDCHARSIDNRINIGRNWRYSFPYLLTNDGGGISANKVNGNIIYEKTPMYLVMADGTKYPIENKDKKENRYISHCQTDNLYLNCDFNSKGGTDSCFELVHMDGTMDYFNKYGQWISTVNRFGNSIKIISDVETDTTETVIIQDTLGKNVTIFTTKTSNGYEQHITRPDNTVIKYIYENINVDNGLERTILKEKRETVDGTNTISTKYEYTYSSGYTEDKLGDTAENMLLTKITYPTGLVSHYEYKWHKRYFVRNNVFYQNGWRVQYIWKLNPKSDPKVSKKWLTVNGTDKNIITYSYDEFPSKYSKNYILDIPGEYCNNKENVKDVPISGRNDGLVEEIAESYKSDFIYEGSSREYSMSAVNSSTYKSYIYYGFSENGRIDLIENYNDNILYSKVENFYDTDPLHNLYPKTRITTVGDSVKTETFSYGTGSFFIHTVSDSSGNANTYERTDYDSGKTFDGHYALPLKTTIRKNDIQNIVTEYTLVNDGTGNSKKAIATEKTYLSDSSGTTRSRTDYTYSSTDLGRLTQQKNYTSGSNYVTTTNTYNGTTALPVKQVYNDGTVNYETNFEYDSLGLLKKVINPKGFTTTYTYDKIGSIITEAFSGGGISTTKSYAYNYTGNTLTLTNENGKKLKYNYDQAGNLSSVVDMTNNNTLERYTYDVYMRPVTQVSGGATTTLTYDNRDRVTSKVTKNSGGTKLAQEDYTYNNNSIGLLTTTTVLGDDNACTYTTSVQQDVLGRTLKETNRQGGVTTYTYDMTGNVTKIVPPRINGDYSITYTYDHAGNVLSETETGLMAEEEMKQTATSKYYEYDMLGRLKSSTDGKGKKTNYTYWGGMDWVKEIKTPFSGTTTGKTTYEYDILGNVTKESVSTGTNTTRDIEYEYDALNRVTKSILNGDYTTYQYDKVGNITKQTMANGKQSVSYVYDQLNRPTKYTDALGKSETYTYNNYGDMVKKVDRNGITTNYTYDALHRLTKESATKNGTTTTNSYTYALTGQLVWESNGSIAKNYRYIKTDVGKICSDEFIDLNGLTYRTRRLYNDADMLIDITTYRSDVDYSVYNKDYSYDSKGRLYMFSNKSSSEYVNDSNYYAYYSYDKNDNITQVKVRNGLTSTYSYNDANLLTSLVYKNSSSTIATYSYTYNVDGNMSKKVENGKTTEYTYDGAGRLIKEIYPKNNLANVVGYKYDEAGNRSKLTVMGEDNYVVDYTYDNNNRLLRESKVNTGSSYADLTIYSYDNNGNQVRKDKSKNNLNDKPVTGFYSESEIENTGYGYEKFTYNGLNQLVKFEDEKKNTTDYTYWSDGLRLSKTVNGSKTNFMWDGDQLMMTIANEETKSYAKAPGYMRSGTSKELAQNIRYDKFYLFNGHGDVTGITDKNGNLEKSYEYDAFGNEINPSKNDTNPFRYCSEYYDEETESIYLRARYYNPSTGRFTAEDPIKDGLNWYAYCVDNPVMFTDPQGLTLQISGYENLSAVQQKQIKSDLNKLMINDINAGTYDAIVKVSGEGNVTLNVLNDNPSTAGYRVLDTIIESDDMIVINFDTSPVEKGETKNKFTINKRNGLDTGVATINYNINSSYMADEVYGSIDNRTFKKEQMTTAISLGHELVHAYRYVTNQNIKDLDKRTKYEGTVPAGVSDESRFNYSEELETVGLVEWEHQNSSGRITENDLRVQLGMPKRGWY